MTKEQELQKIVSTPELEVVGKQKDMPGHPFILKEQKTIIQEYTEIPKSEEKPFSEVATEFAEKAHKQAIEDPASMKIENQSAMDQVEFASRFFQMYNSVFRNMINKMNKKAAARVITTLVAYPLETDKLSWRSKEEKDAFFIGNQLLETKFMLYKYVAMGEAEKAKLAQKPIKEEIIEGEKING